MAKKEDFILNQPVEVIEMRFIGSLLIKNDVIVNCIDIVKPTHFESKINGNIYHAMIDIFQSGEAFNEQNILSYLVENNLWDNFLEHSHILKYKALAKSSIDAVFLAKEVKKRYISREIYKSVEEIRSKKEEGVSPDKLLEIWNQKSFILNDIEDNKNVSYGAKLDIDTYMANLEENIYNPNYEITGLPLGFPRLERSLDGANKGYVLTIAGESQSGKTAFMLDIVKAIDNHNKIKNIKYPIVIYSLEMTKIQLINRLICKEANINGKYLKFPKLYFLENEIEMTEKNVEEFKLRIKNATEKVNNYNMIIDSSEVLSIQEIITRSRKIKMQYGEVSSIFIDHCILVKNNNNDEFKDIVETYSGIRMLAKNLNCPIFILNQFLKDIKNSNDYCPDVYNLRGGQSALNDSHCILMLYRPCIYPKLMEEKPHLKNVCQVIIGKSRETESVGTINLKFDGIGFCEA